MIAAGFGVSRATIIKNLMNAGLAADPTFGAAMKLGAELYKAATEARDKDMVA